MQIEMQGDIEMLEGNGVPDNTGELGDTGGFEDIGMLLVVVLLVDIQGLKQEDDLKMKEEIL